VPELRRPIRGAKGEVHSQIFPSRSAAKATQSLAANISADVVLLLQDYGALDQLKNQCRDTSDSHHRPHNHDGTSALASVRQSFRMRSHCLLTIRKPSDDLSFHLVHRCNRMRPLTRAWQNTSATSSSATFASPLSTPVHRKTEHRAASPIDCHSDVSSSRARIYCRQLGLRHTAVSPTIAKCMA
jgi:hypothetical protein